eukprot:421497_1
MSELEKPSDVWTFSEEELNSTPSIADGLTLQQEEAYRYKTCGFISELSRQLGIQALACSTATIYFQRFFAVHSFKKHNRFIVAQACLFLACKVEEQIIPLRRIVREASTLRDKGSSSASSSSRPQQQQSPRQIGSDNYRDVAKQVLPYEQKLLHTIAFDFSVSAPHLDAMIVIRDWWRKVDEMDNSKKNASPREFTQIAFNFVNDSLRTSLCLRHSAAEFARCCVCLAVFATSGEQVPTSIHRTVKDDAQWWKSLLGITTDTLCRFCSNVMAMYHAVGVSSKAKFDLESLGAELLHAKLLSPPTPPPLKPLIVENDNTDSGGGKATTVSPNTARDTASAPVPSPATTGAASTNSNQNNCSRVPVNGPGVCAPKQQLKYNSSAALLRSHPSSSSASICGKRPHPQCEAIGYRGPIPSLAPTDKQFAYCGTTV